MCILKKLNSCEYIEMFIANTKYPYLIIDKLSDYINYIKRKRCYDVEHPMVLVGSSPDTDNYNVSLYVTLGEDGMCYIYGSIYHNSENTLSIHELYPKDLVTDDNYIREDDADLGNFNDKYIDSLFEKRYLTQLLENSFC